MIPEHWSILGNVDIPNMGYVNSVGFASPTIGMLIGPSNRFDVSVDGGINLSDENEILLTSQAFFYIMKLGLYSLMVTTMAG